MGQATLCDQRLLGPLQTQSLAVPLVPGVTPPCQAPARGAHLRRAQLRRRSQQLWIRGRRRLGCGRMSSHLRLRDSARPAPPPASPRRDWLSYMWAGPLCWDSRRLTGLVPTWPGASLSGPDGGELGSAEKGGRSLLGDPDQLITSIALGRWFTKRSL